MQNRNRQSWDYFKDFENKEVAEQLSYYHLTDKAFLKGIPVEVQPANFELYFINRQNGITATKMRERTKPQTFYSIESAVKAVRKFLGEEPLFLFSFPGCNYLSCARDPYDGKCVMSGANYLFPTCIMPIREIAGYFNILDRAQYVTCGND